MDYTFTTPEPVELYIELGAGDLSVQAAETTTTSVTVEGRDAEEVIVEQRGRQIAVIGPRRWLGVFSGLEHLRVTAVVPTDSDLVTRLGATSMDASGRYGQVRVRAGSGEIRIAETTGATTVDAGSGEVELGTTGRDLRVRSGSGEVRISRAVGSVGVSTGSGDITIGHTEAPAALKTASGEIEVEDAGTDLRATTASGRISVGAIRKGRLRARTASGSVRVGVPAGVPVWTDIGSVSGRVSSNLQGGGRPGPGEDYIELHISTASGSVQLVQLT